MAPNTTTGEQAPTGISPYTIAMERCLVKLDGEWERPEQRAVVHTLVNLVQGRMLEYLADRICREYDIDDAASRQRIVAVLLRIFSDEFFALFRTKVDVRPGLVAKIAKRILRAERQFNGSGLAQRALTADRLFPAIFSKYFEYSNTASLLEMVESDAEIQKIVLFTLLRREVHDAGLLRRVGEILDGDEEGLTPKLLMDYLTRDGVATLADKVQSGEWEGEREDMRRRLAHLRGD